jgi:hypothetical protein
MEAEMRTVVTTLTGLIALAAVLAHGTPVAPTQGTEPELGAGSLIELVAHGCGYGQKRTQWQDQWGQWHWGRCVPKTWGNLPRHQFSQ